MIVRPEALKLLARHRTDQIVVTTMSVIKEWVALTNNYDLDFPFVGAMGQGASVGLGLALSQPKRKVWILNGDGSQLMHLGSIASIAHNGATNVVSFVFQNDRYEITGGQPIPLAGLVDFPSVARGLGFKRVHSFSDLSELEADIPGILMGEGPVFIVLKVVPPAEPFKAWRPNMPEEVAKLQRALKA